jgi:hypothetical protein
MPECATADGPGGNDHRALVRRRKFATGCWRTNVAVAAAIQLSNRVLHGADFYLRVLVASILASRRAGAGGPKPMRLPPADFASALGALTFGGSFEGKVPYGWGVLVLQLNGVFFTFVYATLVGPILPGPHSLHGAMYGAMLFVASAGVFAPVYLGTGMFLHKVHPRAWLTSGMVHGAFGPTARLCPVVDGIALRG